MKLTQYPKVGVNNPAFKPMQCVNREKKEQLQGFNKVLKLLGRQKGQVLKILGEGTNH